MPTSAKLILGAYGVAAAGYVLLFAAALITGGRAAPLLERLDRFAPIALGLVLAGAVALGLRDYVRHPDLRTPGRIAITIAGLVGAVLLLRPRLNVTRLRAAVTRNLPPGTPATRIETYLDSLRIFHGTAVPSHDSKSVWLISASVQDWRRPHLLSDGIFLQFWLDSSFKLIRTDVDESWTMP